MPAKPCSTHWPHPPGGAVDGRGGAPEVRIVMSYPASGAPLDFGGAGARFTEVHYHLYQRVDTFGQIAGFSGPVVHLRVDVDGVFAAPRRVHAFVPKALEIRRLAARSRTRDKQVPAKLEIKGRQLRIISGRKTFDALVR